MPDTNNFDNDQPYTAIAGELWADIAVLLAIVRAQRPEVAAFGNTPIVTVDLSTRKIMVGLSLPDDRIAVVEQVNCDPSHPAEFGASSLPIAVSDYGPAN